MRYIRYFGQGYAKLLEEYERYVLYGIVLLFIIFKAYTPIIWQRGYPGDAIFSDRRFDGVGGSVCSSLTEVPILFIALVKISQDSYHSANVLKLHDFHLVWIGQVVKCIVNAGFMAGTFLIVELIVNLPLLPNFVNFSEETSIFAKVSGAAASRMISPIEVICKYFMIKMLSILFLSLVFSLLNIVLNMKKALFFTFIVHIIEGYFYYGLLGKLEFVFSYKSFITDIFPAVRVCSLMIIILILLGYLLISKKDVLE